MTPLVDVAEAVFFHPEGQELTPRGAEQRSGEPVSAFHLVSGHLALLLVVVVVDFDVDPVDNPWQIHFPPEHVLRVPGEQ